ncbi:MFS transporter [Chitinophaga dinghuensis]|uniref:MFS transporter n=1 Tax=Chitinophaga dinghuensis TaxID=1539050 RepID=A0A327VWP4_9BACT|nr:MFS transporter [Chitinophaga dinghuensis]RAJ79274.1 MFS transporter [Chitinophaga dinghuensis]
MAANSPFYHWVPRPLEDGCLIGFLLAQTLISGVSSYSINEVTAGLGQENEIIRIAFYGSSIGLVTMLPIYYRLRQFWIRKRLLLIALTLELILCLVAPLLNYGWEFVAVSFLMGAVKCICLIDGIGMFMARFNQQNSRGLFYGMYYPISFIGGQVAGFLAAWGIIHYDWSFTYYVAIPGIASSMAIVTFLMHPNRTGHKIPLYQMDWTGCFYFVLFTFSLSYVCVFGERLDWLESPDIRLGAGMALFAVIMFLARELTVKRPFIRLDTWKKYFQVRVGITFMILLYLVYNTSAIQTAFMERVLRYDHEYVASVMLYMIPSFLVVIPLTGLLLHRHYSVRILLAIGFTLFTVYYFLTAKLFYPELEEGLLILPQMLKGAAYGITITTLSYYASTNVPKEYNGHRAVFSVASRFVIAMPVTAAILGEWTFHAQRQQLMLLTEKMGLDNYALHNFLRGSQATLQSKGMDSNQAQAAATALLQGKVQQQVIMLAGQDIYTALGFISLIMTITVLLMRQLDAHYLQHRNSYSLLDT